MVYCCSHCILGYAVLRVLSSFAIIPLGRRAGGVNSIVISNCCYCSLPLPRGAVGPSSVCNCVISWSYSLSTFSIICMRGGGGVKPVPNGDPRDSLFPSHPHTHEKKYSYNLFNIL